MARVANKGAVLTSIPPTQSRSHRALLAALPAAILPTPGIAAEDRPVVWAQALELTGVANLYRVSPQLYRSAQPEAAGFANLENLGIRSVISLRQTVSDTPLATGSTVELYRIPMKSRHVAEQDGAKVVEAMRDLRAASGPVLVHCHHGADRTGLIVALWRILVEGWSKEAAKRELVEGGFGYHAIWRNIPRYIDRVDLSDLKVRIEA